ncbi:PHB depolymerase family esterase [Mesorhizobium sp. B3-2-1]|uniref:extracellular catalytic domain type 1 short-chain-length polyhydroxyalkanoate depolymerase n=1 Tax=unclassified Mesorhizobium TaxID=325217 RepID=UPI00112B2F7A|nr:MULTISPECIES: PHB depolymerase family esterase [unclassified Mesorhizobium]MBZ9710901.1 PHB depolymerase family esterase [Mesorhizobium sp. ESP7-2]TPI29151.1 PHB depolymerase family esterase [Mesorhizobium sp. B3-2-1]
MRKVSDTIARSAAIRARQPSPLPDFRSDRLSNLTGFGSNPGALNARIYLPKGLPKGAPLVVVLHGCTQNAAAYDHHSGWSRLADEAGFALLFPEQQRANNPNLCFNWFLPADVRRGSGEVLSIRQMIETMVVIQGLDRKRIFITGLSAGGAMAAAMLATYPDVFAGGAIIAGLPYGSATTIPEAFDRMRGHGGRSDKDLQGALRSASDHRGPWPRISIWHGTADRTVAHSNAEAVAAQWQGVHGLEKTPTRSEVSGRHARRLWLDPAGEVALEINSIAGMGHGVPLANDGFSAPGPFMLDSGISSTRETARFWGIVATEKSVSTRSRQKVVDGERLLIRTPLPDMEQSPDPNAVKQFPRHTKPAAPGVMTIIEDALRAAGLMR